MPCYCSLSCPCSGACLGIQIQHTEIIAGLLILCLSAAEWHELLTFYFKNVAWVFLSKGDPEKQKWFCSFFCSQGVNPLFFCAFVFSRGRLGSAFIAIIKGLSSIQQPNSALTSMQGMTALPYLQIENIALIVPGPCKSWKIAGLCIHLAVSSKWCSEIWNDTHILVCHRSMEQGCRYHWPERHNSCVCQRRLVIGNSLKKRLRALVPCQLTPIYFMWKERKMVL